MAFDEVTFPETIGVGSSGGPKYFNSIVETALGYEKRVVRWTQALHSYNVSSGLKNSSDLAALINFYIARKGSLNGFRFKDWCDFTSAANNRGTPADTDQPTIELTTTTFQLVKHYISGGVHRVRTITKPVAGSVVVAVGGVSTPSGWSVNTASGIVTFDSPPGATVTAGFEFDVPVRFGEDADKTFSTQPTGFNVNEVGSITLDEVRVLGTAELDTGGGANPTPLDPGFRQARKCKVISCAEVEIDPTKDLYLKFSGLERPPGFPVALSGTDSLVGIEGDINDLVLVLLTNGNGWDNAHVTYVDANSPTGFTDFTIERSGSDLIPHVNNVRIESTYFPAGNSVEIIVFSPFGGTGTAVFRTETENNAKICKPYANLSTFLGDTASGVEAAIWNGTVTLYQGDAVAATEGGETDDSLINLFVPKNEISAYPYYFQWTVDGKCYQVLDTDALQEPGIVAFESTRSATTGCDDADCECNGCANGFTWATGDVAEHNDTLGGGTSDFIHSSGTATICMRDKQELMFNGTSDDWVILTAATDSVTQTYSGVAGDPVTINLPANRLIFRNTSGSVSSAGVPGDYPATVQKTFTDGTLTHVVAAGASGGQVVDMEEDGFTTRNWTDPITYETLNALGWLNALGVAALKLWHVVGGRGFATVTAVLCDGETGGGTTADVADVTVYNTGEVADPLLGSGYERDQFWFTAIEDGVLTIPAYITTGPFGHYPLEGTKWIAATAGGVDMGEYSLYTEIVLGETVNVDTFEIPISFSAGNHVEQIYVNDVSQEITVGYPTAIDEWTTKKLGNSWVVGSNIVRVVIWNEGYMDIEALNFKFGRPTW